MAEDLNPNLIKARWDDIKAEIKRSWGKVTDDELNQTQGDLKAIEELIQKKYGIDKVAFDKRVNSIVAEFRRDIEETRQDTRNHEHGVGAIRDQYRQF